MARAKGRTKATQADSGLVDLMKNVTQDAKRNKVSMMDLSEFENTYGIRYYITTGLPSLDFHLFQNRQNNDESVEKPYGFPTGRIVEIAGEEQSYKTWITHHISSQVRKMGGIVFLIQTEADFDLSFYKDFYSKKGLDFDTEVVPFVRASHANTVGEATAVLKTILPRIREFYESNDKEFPILIVLDSLGAMMATENRERFEKDEDDRMGQHASEIHKMFKYVLEDLGRYNICFLVANHFRKNLSGYGKKFTPAHDDAVKYYASLRLETKSYNEKGGTVTRYGNVYRESRILDLSVTKIRSSYIGDGSLKMRVFPNIGFDYLDSLIQAMRYAYIVKKGTKGYEFIFENDIEEREPTAVEAGAIAELDELGKRAFGGDKDFRKVLAENKKLMVYLERLCYERGPKTLGQIDNVDMAGIV